MPEFFSSDGPYFLQFVVIFLVILAVMTGTVLLVRRFSGRGGLSLSARAGQRGRQPRLGIVDIYELDRQRQLILLRRDNVEHLLLVGGPNDVVVERNVTRGVGRLPAESVMRPEPASDMDGQMDGEGEPSALAPPSFEMPVVVPPPMPGAPAQEGRPPPLDPALFEPEAEGPEQPQGPPAKSRVGIAQVGRILRRTPPPLLNPRPDTASERPRPEDPAQEVVHDTAPPVMPPSGSRPVDPAILSDMARHLETALRRQSSAVTPPPVASPPPGPGKAAAPAQPSPPPVSAPTPTPTPTPQPPPPAPPEPRRPDPVAAASAAAQAPNPPPTPALGPAPDAAPQKAPDPSTPFTVEEIETEFARLLGRPLDKKG